LNIKSVFDMTFARKLEIIKRNGNETFEKGLNGVRSIEIIYKKDKVIIEFDDSLEWDYRVVSVNSLDSYQFSEEETQSV
jgi:hypothetical protein